VDAVSARMIGIETVCQTERTTVQMMLSKLSLENAVVEVLTWTLTAMVFLTVMNHAMAMTSRQSLAFVAVLRPTLTAMVIQFQTALIMWVQLQRYGQ